MKNILTALILCLLTLPAHAFWARSLAVTGGPILQLPAAYSGTATVCNRHGGGGTAANGSACPTGEVTYGTGNKFHAIGLADDGRGYIAPDASGLGMVQSTWIDVTDQAHVVTMAFDGLRANPPCPEPIPRSTLGRIPRCHLPSPE